MMVPSISMAPSFLAKFLQSPCEKSTVCGLCWIKWQIISGAHWTQPREAHLICSIRSRHASVRRRHGERETDDYAAPPRRGASADLTLFRRVAPARRPGRSAAAADPPREQQQPGDADRPDRPEVAPPA